MIVFYVLALIVTFLGVVINLPGSIHINPILLHFYDAKTVLLLTTTYLTLGALSRVIIFHKEVVREDLFKIILLAVFGGVTGSFFIGIIPEKVIVILFIISGIKFLYEFYTKKSIDKKSTKSGLFISGFFVSFLQAFGIGAGNIRQGNYFKKGYDLQAVQGTCAVIFLASGLATVLSRFAFEDIDPNKLLLILPIFPFILVTVYLGKKVLYKIPKSVQEKIIVYTLIISLLSVLPKLLK